MNKKLLLNGIRIFITAFLLGYVVSLIQIKDVIQLSQKKQITGYIVYEDKELIILDTSEGRTKIPVEKILSVRKGVITLIKNLHKGMFLLSFLLLLGIGIVGVKRWQMLLFSQHIKLGFWEVFKLTYIGFFFNNFLLGLTGGDIIKAYYVTKHTHKKTAAVVTVFLDRIVGIVALAFMSAIPLLFYLNNPIYKTASVIIYSFLLSVIIGCVIFYSKRVRRYLRHTKLLKYIPFKQIFKEIDKIIYLYSNKKEVIFKTLFISIIAHACAIISNWAIARALGIENVSLVSFFVFIPVIFIITSLPISVSGWGVGEATYVVFFTQAGISQTHAITISVLYRLCMLIWSLPGGVFLLFLKDRPTAQQIEKEISID